MLLDDAVYNLVDVLVKQCLIAGILYFLCKQSVHLVIDRCSANVLQIVFLQVDMDVYGSILF